MGYLEKLIVNLCTEGEVRYVWLVNFVPNYKISLRELQIILHYSTCSFKHLNKLFATVHFG